MTKSSLRRRIAIAVKAVAATDSLPAAYAVARQLINDLPAGVTESDLLSRVEAMVRERGRSLH